MAKHRSTSSRRTSFERMKRWQAGIRPPHRTERRPPSNDKLICTINRHSPKRIVDQKYRDRDPTDLRQHLNYKKTHTTTRHTPTKRDKPVINKNRPVAFFHAVDDEFYYFRVPRHLIDQEQPFTGTSPTTTSKHNPEDDFSDDNDFEALREIIVL